MKSFKPLLDMRELNRHFNGVNMDLIEYAYLSIRLPITMRIVSHVHQEEEI